MVYSNSFVNNVSIWEMATIPKSFLWRSIILQTLIKITGIVAWLAKLFENRFELCQNFMKY